MKSTSLVNKDPSAYSAPGVCGIQHSFSFQLFEETGFPTLSVCLPSDTTPKSTGKSKPAKIAKQHIIRDILPKMVPLCGGENGPFLTCGTNMEPPTPLTS